MRFLIDAQLPPDLARFLASCGYQAQHVAEIGLLSAGDREIWEHAKVVKTAIITKDTDFAALTILDEGPQIVWIRFGNTRKAELTKRLSAALPRIISALLDGLVEVA